MTAWYPVVTRAVFNLHGTRRQYRVILPPPLQTDIKNRIYTVY